MRAALNFEDDDNEFEEFAHPYPGHQELLRQNCLTSQVHFDLIYLKTTELVKSVMTVVTLP